MYLVGDSVLRQLCVLGRPGLCCNGRVLCDNAASLLDGDGSNPRDMSNYGRPLPGDATDDWQHLIRYRARGGNHPNVTLLSPNATHHGDGGAQLLQSVIGSAATADDILIAGLLGNHFQPRDMPKWQQFCQHFITNVVGSFPGRVLLLSSSPQHFAGTGAYYSGSGQKHCGPTVPSLDATAVDTVPLRAAIWDTAVMMMTAAPHSNRKIMEQQRIRVLTTSPLLSPLWMCHRSPTDCTHWTDGVYSMLAAVVTEMLATIQ